MPVRHVQTSASRQAVMDTALAFAMLRPTASLDEIAIAAGVGRATLFRHFPNRTALLREAGRQVLDDVDARLAAEIPALGSRADARRALRAVLEVLVDGGLPLHAVFSAPGLADDAALRAASKRLDRHIAPVLAAAADAGLLRADLDAAWRDAAFDGLLFAAWTAVREGRLAREDAPDRLLSMLLHGFGPERRR
jgi:AcrR family transcriptional regulator